MNIFISGTSRGFGYALAKYYLNGGYNVYGVSRTENEELNSHPRFHQLTQDIAHLNKLEESLKIFLKDINSFALIILNAGVLNDIKDLKETSVEEIKHVMDINVWANKILIDTLFNSVGNIKQIVAVSSGAAVNGTRGWNAYSLSKAALNMLISLYAKEHKNTHFCSIAPGLVDTDMQKFISSLKNDERYPVVNRLKEARSSGKMPSSAEAAITFVKAVEAAKNYESGIFLDVRKL